jgi:DedD protein
MGLLSFLKRKSGDAPKAPGIPESADSVQQARTRARQRLVGAVVLVAAGVVGFPLLFETQPRPLPVDTPIEIARKESAVPALPAPRTSPAPRPVEPVEPPSVITVGPADSGRETAAAPNPVASTVAPAEPSPVAKPAVEPKPEQKPEPKPEHKPEPKSAPKPEAKPVDGARAQALLEGKEAAPSKPSTTDGRFVVQVGAFSEVNAAREARQKVEKLGLKTYTQVVETSAGKRIRVRVGPFASRDDADKAAGKIKSAGLSSAVFTL